MDQAVIKEDGTPDYIDSVDSEIAENANKEKIDTSKNETGNQDAGAEKKDSQAATGAAEEKEIPFAPEKPEGPGY